MATAAVVIGAIAALAGTGYGIYAGEQNAKAQKSAQQDAKDAAMKAESQADQANNRANQKKPNTNAILAAAQLAAKSGIGGTMLTGPAGVGSELLSLGKSSLLGG